MQITRLESPGKPQIGGILCIFGPDKPGKQVKWESDTPILDTMTLAKNCAAAILDSLMRDGRIEDADFTNWVSAVAGMQKVIKDWNQRFVFAEIANSGPQIIQ